MKKIIPFKKELFLKNNIAEIVSISLEHTLHHEKDYLISGEFIITGDYKITDSSEHVENFEFKVPFDINIDEKYILDHMIIDIDDFYYEIVNNNALIINIEVLIDKLEEKEIIEERCIDEEEIDLKQEIIENTFNDNNIIEEKIEQNIIENKVIDKIDKASEKIEEVEEKIEQIKEKIKGFVTYRVCIVKEEDTVEKLIDRYKINREMLEEYNDLRDLKVGDKIIIPNNE